MGFFSDVGALLIQIIFGFVILAIMLRYLLQAVHADFHNPIAQIIYRLTNPIIAPFQFMPRFRSVDLSSILLMFLLQYVMLILLNLVTGSSPLLVINLVKAPFDLMHLLLNIYLFSIIVMVVVSWIQPGSYNPIVALINQIIHPIMEPVRRRIPPLGGLDLSPMVVIILIMIAKLAVSHLSYNILSSMGAAVPMRITAL